VEDLYGRAARRVRRIAIFGPRGTGKTCFFASLYGHSADAACALTFAHDPTMEYLERMWNAYASKGGFPAPTAAEVPQRLVFHVAQSTSGREWEVEVLDSAGEFVERARHRSDNDDLRDIVRTWLRDCEATLIFLDTSRGDGDEALERRNEVAILLQLCREASESGSITRPLGLILTKWDSHGAIGTDPVEEEKRARAYLAQTPAFRQIHATVEQFGRAVEVFPVSAIGADRQPSRKPRNPYNLLRPIVWALEQSDEGRLAAAEREAGRNPRSLARQARAYQELIDADGICSGPVYERFAPRLAELKQGRGWRRVGLLAGAVALLLVALGAGYGGWRRYADRQFQAWAAFCEKEGSDDASAGKRADLADLLLARHGWVLSGEHKTRLTKSRLQDREVERDYGERTEWQGIQQEVHRLDGLEEPQQVEVLEGLVPRLEAFGAQWQGRKAGQDWKDRLLAFKGDLAAKKEQRERFNQVLEQEKPLQEKSDAAGLIRLWEEYLKSEPKPAEYYAAKAGEQLAKAKEAHDTQQLNALLREAGRERYTLDKCGAFINRVIEFKRDRYNKDRNGAEADRLINAELARADGLVYEEARKAVERAQKSLKVEDVRQARAGIANYLDARSVPGAGGWERPVLMRQAASNGLAWFDEVIAGKKYKLTLRSLFVPQGHHLFNNFSGAAASWAYALTLSGAAKYDTYATTPFKTPASDTQTGQTLGNLQGVRISLASMQSKADPGEIEYKLGEGTLKLKVWRSGVTAWYWDEGEIGSDLFVPLALQRGWEVKDAKQSPLTVFIDCAGADIPDLPAFQGGN
jgi:hypothetical protein